MHSVKMSAGLHEYGLAIDYTRWCLKRKIVELVREISIEIVKCALVLDSCVEEWSAV